MLLVVVVIVVVVVLPPSGTSCLPLPSPTAAVAASAVRGVRAAVGVDAGDDDDRKDDDEDDDEEEEEKELEVEEAAAYSWELLLIDAAVVDKLAGFARGVPQRLLRYASPGEVKRRGKFGRGGGIASPLTALPSVLLEADRDASVAAVKKVSVRWRC